MRYLRVDIHFASPVSIGTLPTHLDALLAFCWYLDNGYYDHPATREQIVEPELPLERFRDIWKASAGFVVGVESVDTWHKRWEDRYEEYVDFKGRKEKINIGSGYFKSYAMPLRIISTPKMVFFAVGDKEEIERLLKKYLIAVGKKRRIGYGLVKDVEVFEIDKDRSILMPGGVAREIPVDYVEYYMPNEIIVSTYKIPYWLPDNMKRIYVPKWFFKSLEEFEEYTGEPYLLKHALSS